jgi:hypothetical protein
MSDDGALEANRQLALDFMKLLVDSGTAWSVHFHHPVLWPDATGIQTSDAEACRGRQTGESRLNSDSL